MNTFPFGLCTWPKSSWYTILYVCLTAYTYTFYATYTKHLFVLCMFCFVLLLHRRSFLFCFDSFRTLFAHFLFYVMRVLCTCLFTKQTNAAHFQLATQFLLFFPNILMQNNCVLFWFHRYMYFYFTGKLYSRTHASNVQILKLYIDVSTLFLWKHYHSTSVKWVICQHGFVTMQ